VRKKFIELRGERGEGRDESLEFRVKS